MIHQEITPGFRGIPLEMTPWISTKIAIGSSSEITQGIHPGTRLISTSISFMNSYILPVISREIPNYSIPNTIPNFSRNSSSNLNWNFTNDFFDVSSWDFFHKFQKCSVCIRTSGKTPNIIHDGILMKLLMKISVKMPV